jgi:hypothetical protein
MATMILRDRSGTVLATGEGEAFRPTVERLYRSLAPRANRNKVLCVKQHFVGGNTYHVQLGTGPRSLDDLLVVRWDGGE